MSLNPNEWRLLSAALDGGCSEPFLEAHAGVAGTEGAPSRDSTGVLVPD